MLFTVSLLRERRSLGGQCRCRRLARHQGVLLVHRRDSDGAVERAYRAIRRHRPGQGSGGIAAKHALALLSSSPPPSPFVTSRRSVDLHARDLDAVDREGPVVVDAVTVDFLQESPPWSHWSASRTEVEAGPPHATKRPSMRSRARRRLAVRPGSAVVASSSGDRRSPADGMA